MNETTTLPNPVLPVIRKCKVEEVFDANFIELLALVPRNPQVRALILKQTGKLPTAECETFAQLKDWVEINCEKKPKPSATQSGRRHDDDGIEISVEFSETEYGRADYSVRRSGSDEFLIGAEALMELVQEAIDAGGGMDEVVDLIAGKIDANAWSQCEPTLETDGHHDYSDHEATDSDDSETEYSREAIRRAVLAFVRERHPELAAEL